MLRQGLILTSQREYAHVMRAGLLSLGDERTRVDVELDALRAMQLVPQQYDLILLDTVLDSMDGLQLLLLMKHQAPSTKFVIVSDAGDEISRAQAYQNGADFFMERPQNPVLLARTLDALRGLLKRGAEKETAQEDQDGPLTRLADIVQTRCLSGDSVLLSIRGQHQSGDIFIFRGEIFHAQYPGRSGEAAFRDMLQWDDGLVRIKALKLNQVPPRTMEIPYRKLLEKQEQPRLTGSDLRLRTGELRIVDADPLPDMPVPEVMLEAPPREASEAEEPVSASAPVPVGQEEASGLSEIPAEGSTPLPAVNAHWKINLMGELVEGSQVADPERCAFITYFIYRKMADIAVTLELDYFNQMMLTGPHLSQVLVADNLGVRHAVFDAPWTDESQREQYVKWCCEQSF